MIAYPPLTVSGRVRPDADWATASGFVPSDKSISHRLLLFAALTPDCIALHDLNDGKAVALLADALSTLGVAMERRDNCLRVVGRLDDSRRGGEPPSVDLGPSSAAARLLIGALVGVGIACLVDGDETLRSRPFDWIVDPLRALGADLTYEGADGALPLRVRPSRFHGGAARTTIGSAQAVSALLFAAIAARRPIEIDYPVLSRDHTQTLAASFGDEVVVTGNHLAYAPVAFSMPHRVHVPKDPSAAAYLAALFWLTHRNDPSAVARLDGFCLNPTRLGFFRWMESCGFRLTVESEGTVCGEPVGTIALRGGGSLRGADMASKELLHAMIDEIPLAVGIACLLPGSAMFQDLYELTFKETNRITATADMLRALGLGVMVQGHDIRIDGGQTLVSDENVPSFGDHRLAMTAATLLIASGQSATLAEGRCYRTSFPHFERCLSTLLRRETA